MAGPLYQIGVPGNPERGQGIDPEVFDRDTYTQFQTWLGETKSSEGCPVNCTYCFFKLDGQTPKRPDILMSPEDTIEAIADAPSYHPNIPVHFGSQTDAFSSKANIEHYSKILRLYGESDYPNPLVFITKRRIPAAFMDLAVEVPQDVLFYISYSGLNETGLEATTNERHQRDNFVQLHERGLPTVHYWRPFLPQNSRPERIDDILSFVSQYADCSVANGLRLNSGIQENIAPFWPEIMDQEYDFHKTGEFWPEGVRNFLRRHIALRYPDYPVYMGNTSCSVAYTTGQPDIQGLYGGRMCQESNCLTNQRESCLVARQQPTQAQVEASVTKFNIDPARIVIEDGKVLIDQQVETGTLVHLRYALRAVVLGRTVEYAGGHNWANVTDDVPITEVPWEENTLLPTG